MIDFTKERKMIMNKIELDIIPPKSTGQSGKRLGIIKNHAMMFKTKEAKDVENMYWSLLYNKRPDKPYEGSLKVNYYFFFPYNSSVKKSIAKKKLIVPKLTKPDYDNIPKQIQDVLTKCQYWTDDSLIFDGSIKKYFAPFGKIVITIEELDKEIDLTEELTQKGII